MLRFPLFATVSVCVFGLLVSCTEGNCADSMTPADRMTYPHQVLRQPLGGPSGVPCNGLVFSLQLSTELERAYPGPMPVDLMMTNVGQTPAPVRPLPYWTCDPNSYFPKLVLFDADGRAIYPLNLELGSGIAGYSGPGPQPPVQLGPGESVRYWFYSLSKVCTGLRLPAGRYRAQVIAHKYRADRQKPPNVLVSNVLSFEWKGPVK